MKIWTLTIQIIFLSQSCFGQKFLDSILFNTSVTGDFAQNFKGGIKKGYTYIGMEQLTIELNTEKAGLWYGGDFFIRGINVHGIGPTKSFVGDMMYFSNIEAGNYTGVFEYFYFQDFNKFSLLIGQRDLNAEFAGSKYGENFINSTFGVISNLALNIPAPVYPVAAPCVLLRFQPSSHLMWKLAIWDGDPGNIDNSRFGINWHFNNNEGFLHVSEISYTIINHNQHGIYTEKGIKMGAYKLGMFYHSGYFKNYDDTLQTMRGNYGFYFIADQMILPKPSNPEEGLAFMVQCGFSPKRFNMISNAVEAGIRYHGILPWRSRDFAGLAFTYAGLGSYFLNDYPMRAPYESSIEFTYKFQFNKNYTIQPNFQYILYPGATKGIDNAFVGLLRLQLNY